MNLQVYGVTQNSHKEVMIWRGIISDLTFAILSFMFDYNKLTLKALSTTLQKGFHMPIPMAFRISSLDNEIQQWLYLLCFVMGWLQNKVYWPHWEREETAVNGLQHFIVSSTKPFIGWSHYICPAINTTPRNPRPNWIWLVKSYKATERGRWKQIYQNINNMIIENMDVLSSETLLKHLNVEQCCLVS